MFKKFLAGAAVATSLFALSAPASATLTNWYIDTDGAGGNAPVLVKDYLDLVGQAYVHNTFNEAGTAFSFNEVGLFTSATADGGYTPPFILGGANLNPALSASFVGTGTGTLGGNLTFNAGGELEVYSLFTNIADFTLLEGSAVLQANSTLPNGTVSLIFKATMMEYGYFFAEDGITDLASLVNSIDGLVLGFATTNAISLAGQTVDSGLFGFYNTNFAPVTGPIVGNLTTDLYISNNGQFRVDVSEIPEPSMLSLLGLALVGFGFTTRRKVKATDKAA